ncbi:MAG TPA: hypothetical protein VNV66_04830 [Pilimelia sp.]|nr:hypothetical protein [Pilimelia sp.]
MTRDQWRAAWTEALDELEADVEAVEALLADDHRQREAPPATPWNPPTGLGPLPLDLRPRADGILSRQLTAAAALAAAMTSNRRQVAFAAKVEHGGGGKTPPSYVDCAM